MSEREAQYDHIGGRYDEYARRATLKRAECHTVLQLAGDVTGLAALDLACGFGFYTRLLRRGGASRAVGIDISPEMIVLAQQKEVEDPLGVDFHAADAAALAESGEFDLLTAVHLLNYAATREELVRMLRGIRGQLKEGGRFVGYTSNPTFSLAGPNKTKYGITILRQTAMKNVFHVEAEFMTDPPTRFQYYQWDRETYEWAADEAGMRDFRWHPTQVSPADLAEYGEDYWRDFLENDLNIGVTCRR